MGPHSSTLAWKILWTEEPGRLQFMGSLRVRHDWATSLSLFTFMHWRRKWQPTQCSCLENPRHGGGWWAAVYGVTQSRTRLKWLSSSSSSSKHKRILEDQKALSYRWMIILWTMIMNNNICNDNISAKICFFSFFKRESFLKCIKSHHGGRGAVKLLKSCSLLFLLNVTD